MKRLFWVAVGATVTVIVVRKVTRVKRSYGPSGLGQKAGAVGQDVRSFVDDVLVGMHEREAELRRTLGLDGLAARGRKPVSTTPPPPSSATTPAPITPTPLTPPVHPGPPAPARAASTEQAGGSP
jgi:hypothetical protein